MAKAKILKSKVDSLRTVSTEVVLEMCYLQKTGETRAYETVKTFSRNGSSIM